MSQKRFNIYVYKKSNELGEFEKKKALEILYELREKYNHKDGEFRIIMKETQSD